MDSKVGLIQLLLSMQAYTSAASIPAVLSSPSPVALFWNANHVRNYR